MSIPFSNTTQRIPRGFANLLEGLAREVLRNQPQDIPSFAAKYFENLLIEREKTGFDPTEWGAKLEDRYYNNRAFNELAPPGGTVQKEDKKEEPEEAKTSDTTEESSTTLTEEQAAIKIQASFRGYKTRKEINSPKEESDEKDEKDEKDKKDEKEEPTEPDKKEPEEPEKKEPEQVQ